jgi:hypothetical protein
MLNSHTISCWPYSHAYPLPKYGNAADGDSTNVFDEAFYFHDACAQYGDYGTDEHGR